MRKYNIHSFWDVRRYLITKIDYFERQGYKFFHICEMTITFLSDLRNMTYEHYLKQPKQKIEWVLNKKLHKNPVLIKTLRNISHPLIRKNKYVIKYMYFPQKKIMILYITFQVILFN